jgi:hypothetical protein
VSSRPDPRVAKVIAEIKEANVRLIRILRRSTTGSILKFASGSLLSLQFRAKHENLSAPVKQIFHILGLMLVTPAHRPNDIKEEDWRTIERLVERIFFLYAHLFFSFAPEEPKRERLIEATGPAFIQYFQTFALYYEEQLHGRIRSWFGPFDSVIREALGMAYRSKNC